jgi:hypothetical protein
VSGAPFGPLAWSGAGFGTFHALIVSHFLLLRESGTVERERNGDERRQAQPQHFVSPQS